MPLKIENPQNTFFSVYDLNLNTLAFNPIENNSCCKIAIKVRLKVVVIFNGNK